MLPSDQQTRHALALHIVEAICEVKRLRSRRSTMIGLVLVARTGSGINQYRHVSTQYFCVGCRGKGLASTRCIMVRIYSLETAVVPFVWSIRLRSVCFRERCLSLGARRHLYTVFTPDPSKLLLSTTPRLCNTTGCALKRCGTLIPKEFTQISRNSTQLSLLRQLSLPQHSGHQRSHYHRSRQACGSNETLVISWSLDLLPDHQR